MSALACRSPASHAIQGSIQINGLPANVSYMRQHSCFMHQEEILIGTMTVAEYMWFMARMKLSGHIANSDINLRIKSLLFDVGLISALNEKIGSDNDKILSGGEKKRLVFAAELISDPSILFLDEPTTGQDAYTASILVKQLHSFAAQGRTVLCTIHQPSSEVFNSFKKIILLANGRIAYIGTSTDALNFFSSLGYVCPHLYNPADFLIGTLVSNPNESFNITTAQRLCDSFLSSDASKKIDLILQSEIHRTRTVKNMLIETGNQPGELLFRQKILWMIHREILHILRDPSVQLWRIIQKIVVAFLASMCFFGAINQDQLGIQAVQGVIFILISENTFFPMYGTLSLIPQRFSLFLREYEDGLYSVHVYYLSQVIALLPGLALESIVFTTIVYWLSDLSNSITEFCLTLFIILLTINVSTACGFFFSTSFENVALAMAYLVPFDYLLMITMGLFIKLRQKKS